MNSEEKNDFVQRPGTYQAPRNVWFFSRTAIYLYNFDVIRFYGLTDGYINNITPLRLRDILPKRNKHLTLTNRNFNLILKTQSGFINEIKLYLLCIDSGRKEFLYYVHGHEIYLSYTRWNDYYG